MKPSVEPAHHEATTGTAGSATTSSSSNGRTTRGADDASSSPPGHRWVVVAVALVIAVVGLVGASVAGVALASENAARARQSFARSSADVASTLQLTIREEESLIISASAFVLASPNASNAEFVKWLGTVHGFDRHPEVDGMLFIVFVQSSDLAPLMANIAADPAAAFGPKAPDEIVPPGERPFYCFAALGAQAVASAVPLARGTDLCADPTGGSALISARDSGNGSYEPVVGGQGTVQLGLQTPVYRNGVVPPTVEARRAAFIGWTGVTLNQTSVLERALQSHPGMTASIHYLLNSSDVAFASGPVPSGAQSTSIDLHNGWTVQTFSVIDQGGVFDNWSATMLLLSIAAMSLVIAVLVLVLGTGRLRALRLVAERTGQLRHQALHDALTDLPNRALIMDRIDQLLARNRRQGTSGAALFVDLDDFKNVNDTLGHLAGDGLLIAVAARLTTTLRDADTIGRMGGDEFVVLIDGGPQHAAPALVAQRLLDVMRQPFDIDGAPLPIIVNTSIGIAIGDRPTAGDLLRDADVALYQAKGAGKNQFALFDAAMQTVFNRQVELEFELRAALDADQFRLAYQPIYNLDDLTVIGVEALLRWDHPTMGLIEPDEFIPLLEQSGQIDQIGRWVLQQACKQMSAWHAAGDTLDVSVNVSGRQLDHDAIVEDIRQALADSGLPPAFLIIEITETALMVDAAATAVRLRAIRELGVRIAVDDFGTGYSSLAYLQQFPVDSIKIDRRFTHAISTSPESRALIRTLVQLGKDLGLKILAEGVESTTEIDHLRSERVNEAQGFLLSRPLDPATLEAQLLAPTRATSDPVQDAASNSGGQGDRTP